MNIHHRSHRLGKFSAAVLLLTSMTVAHGQSSETAIDAETRTLGPYNVRALFGGPGLTKPLPPKLGLLAADAAWTLSMGYGEGPGAGAGTLLAGVGDAAGESSRVLALVDGKPALRLGGGSLLVAQGPIARTGWHQLAATFDGVGRYTLYADGAEVASGTMPSMRVGARLVIAPVPPALPAPHVGDDGLPAPAIPETPAFEHFGGSIAELTLMEGALAPRAVTEAYGRRPDFGLPTYETNAPAWPLQSHSPAGMLAPQDPSLMPHSRAPLGTPVAKPLPAARATLEPAGPSRWTVAANWRLIAAPGLNATPQQIAAPGLDTKRWMAATVPGTVLTTMIDRGIYPDPDFGLNNLAIPESLNKQDYWYRVEFPTPEGGASRHMSLTFNGINYAAEVWLNGARLGAIRGAFIRGTFDVTGHLAETGENVLAVRISPPPHPGIPQEQSIKGGPGPNGGALCLDGPTFVATEGWDWIPAIRDRNTGMWQDVVLAATDNLHLGDAQVITRLPLPEISSAEVEINVPVRNVGDAATTTLTASFEGVTVTKQVQMAPGESVVRLTSAEFPQLHLANPRLWWPNGYGKPELYHLQLALGDSDHKQMTFGVREVTYELTLFAPDGHLRRVEVDPTVARGGSEAIVDVSHEGMLPTATGFASSLTMAGTNSPAVRPVPNAPAGMEDLVLKVNGVRIAARGGNWGMDDSRKRVSREHLEPFFKLHQQANLNIIRNWVGQDTEETFFELADEYGMMVWNDFWASTQNYNVEPEDPQLFLDNARDVVLRYRNHPSIVVWCGRNEGVPQPVINQGLIHLFAELDETRYYSPSSNRVNLRNSGPYHYQDPETYYAINKGFSVELGIASMSTLESFQASIAKPDQWPISDAWAYHDWHQGSNGDVAPLMAKIEEQFGAGTDLKDFERKAQMFNYVDHRAIFEGFNQHLWTPNSGRMLWMTQPAWPSNMWQIMSSDYDTQASFYGVQKACEPQHVQMDLADGSVVAVNTSRTSLPGAHVRASVYSLTNQPLLTRDATLDLVPNTAAPVFKLNLAPVYPAGEAVLVKLEMTSASGAVLSTNLYWMATRDADFRSLNTLPPVRLEASAAATRSGDTVSIQLKLTNPSASPALAIKATTTDARTGERILPAYLTDNYISLLPGETRTIDIQYPASASAGAARIGLRGWNIQEGTVNVAAPVATATPAKAGE